MKALTKVVKTTSILPQPAPLNTECTPVPGLAPAQPPTFTAVQGPISHSGLTPMPALAPAQLPTLTTVQEPGFTTGRLMGSLHSVAREELRPALAPKPGATLIQTSTPTNGNSMGQLEPSLDCDHNGSQELTNSFWPTFSFFLLALLSCWSSSTLYTVIVSSVPSHSYLIVIVWLFFFILYASSSAHIVLCVFSLGV